MTRKKIKQYKGRLVSVTYKNRRGSNNIVTGLIVADGSTMMIFKQKGRDGLELPIRYCDVIHVE